MFDLDQMYTHQTWRTALSAGDIVLFPFPLRDGAADGFRYRMIYIPPNVFQDMLGGQPLPFLPGGITTDTRMAESVVRLLRHIDSPLETFEEDDALFDLASAMNAHAGARPAPRPRRRRTGPRRR